MEERRLKNLEFKAIKDIEGISFVIPSFQRGYRWSKGNITRLFNDILENNNGYLLHSLYLGVKKEVKDFIVVDGQQRLTAIYIILSVLYRRFKGEKLKINIRYESRECSGEFLNFLFSYKGEVLFDDIKKGWEDDKEDMNLDFEYMIESYIEIYKAIDACEDDIQSFKNKLLESKFIWVTVEYESKKDLIDKFGKVNMGKIPLNNAELIKTELLNYKNIDKSFGSNSKLDEIETKQYEVVRVWSDIDKVLHYVDLWAFIPHKGQYENNNYVNRIEYILRFYLFKKKSGKENYETYMKGFVGDFSLYDSFVSYLIQEKSTSNEIIKDIYCLFKELESLYNNDGRNIDCPGDKNIYNYISYFVYYNDSINKDDYLNSFQLFYEVLEKNRNERSKIVKEKIKEKVFKDKEIKDKILKLNYTEHDGEYSKKEMLNILLLYNIILIGSAQGCGNRYNFIEYASKTWTAEHIFPQNINLCLMEGKRNDIKVIKEILESITINLHNKEIVLNKEYALRYVNYLHQKESDIFLAKKGMDYENMTQCKVYPDILKKSKKNKIGEEIMKFDYELKSLEKLQLSDNLYEKEFGNKMCLIVKSSEILEKLQVYQECKKMRESKSKIDNEKKDFINNNKSKFEKYEILLIEKAEGKIDLSYTEKIRREIELLKLNIDSEKERELEEKIEKIKVKIEKQQEKGINKYESNDISELIVSEAREINSILYKVVLDNIVCVDDKTINRIIENYIIKVPDEINDFLKNEFDKLMLDNSIANISLLDKKVNSSKEVGNNFFCDKKIAVFKLMKNGEFIPLSTILTFADVYTKHTDRYWLYKSRCNYLRDLILTVEDFFKKG